MLRIKNMQVPLVEEAALPVLVAKRLGLPPQAVLGVVIVRKAIDARRYRGAPIQFTYMLDVEVEGPKSLLDEVNRVIGYVGLSGNGTDFSLQVPLTAINVDGREVSGIIVRPSSVQADVQLARGLTKKVVKIKALTKGSLPKGLVMSGVKVDPVKIEIAGSDEVLSQITAVETEEIDLGTADKSTSRKVQLKLPEGVTVTNKEVTVYLDIKKSDEKEK